jgi:hypothetical protein
MGRSEEFCTYNVRSSPASNPERIESRDDVIIRLACSRSSLRLSRSRIVKASMSETLVSTLPTHVGTVPHWTPLARVMHGSIAEEEIARGHAVEALLIERLFDSS